MTNSVIDLSNIFFRSLFSMNKWGKETHTFDSEEDLSQLMRKVSTDLTQILRTILPRRVIITVDSSSWRKNIEIVENEGYKGNREKSGSINWTNIFELMNEFSKILDSKGFIVSEIKKAEADDLMALWTEEFVRRGEHVILVSGDEDIRQLVDSHFKDGDVSFVTLFNPFTQGKNASKKLFYPKGFIEWTEGEAEVDQMSAFFDTSNKDIDKEDFRYILDNKNIQSVELYGPDISLHKIFCGDDGDNVPAFYTWNTKVKKTGKMKETRITPSKFKKIKEALKITHPLDLIEEAVPEKLEPILKKITEKESLGIDVKKRLDRQIKLVYLNSDFFPESINNIFNKKKDELLLKDKMLTNSINMKNILEGTKYLNTNYTKSKSNQISIFADIDKIANKELF